jgi:hypothetical protein
LDFANNRVEFCQVYGYSEPRDFLAAARVQDVLCCREVLGAAEVQSFWNLTDTDIQAALDKARHMP